MTILDILFLSLYKDLKINLGILNKIKYNFGLGNFYNHEVSKEIVEQLVSQSEMHLILLFL